LNRLTVLLGFADAETGEKIDNACEDTFRVSTENAFSTDALKKIPVQFGRLSMRYFKTLWYDYVLMDVCIAQHM